MPEGKKVLLTIVGAIAAWIVLDLMVLDCWRFRGSVVDRASGQRIAGARVLVSLIGDKPHLPLPHARKTNDVCITSFELTSDESGDFSVTRLWPNQYLINKRAVVSAFAPDWYSSSSVVVSVDPGLISGGTTANVYLNRDEGTRWSSRIYTEDGHPLSMDPQAEEYQRTMSRALTQTARVLSESYICGGDSWGYVLEVLSYVAGRARTASEKQFVLRECKALVWTRAHLEYQSNRATGDDQKSNVRCDESLFDESPRSDPLSILQREGRWRG